MLLLGAKGERDRETASLPSGTSNEGMADKEGRTGAKSQERPLQRSSWRRQLLSCGPNEPQGPRVLMATAGTGIWGMKFLTEKTLKPRDEGKAEGEPGGPCPGARPPCAQTQ